MKRMAAGAPLMGLADDDYKPRLTARFKRESMEREWRINVEFLQNVKPSEIENDSLHVLFDEYGQFCGFTFRLKKGKNHAGDI